MNTFILLFLYAGCCGSTEPMSALEACSHFEGCRQMGSVFGAAHSCESFFEEWPEECLQAMAWSPCDAIGWVRDCHPDCIDCAETACVGDMLVSCAGAYLMEIDSILCD